MGFRLVFRRVFFVLRMLTVTLSFQAPSKWKKMKKKVKQVKAPSCAGFGWGSTKTWNPESGNGNGITETEYGIRERRFQAIDLKKMLAMTIK